MSPVREGGIERGQEVVVGGVAGGGDAIVAVVVAAAVVVSSRSPFGRGCGSGRGRRISLDRIKVWRKGRRTFLYRRNAKRELCRRSMIHM